MLILPAGYLYYKQISAQLLKFEHFSMLEVAKSLKMKEVFPQSYKKEGLSYHVVTKEFKHFSISNFERIGDRFIKYVPKDGKNLYYKIEKPTAMYEQKIAKLKFTIHLVQAILMALFALISYILAKSAIKPLQRSITLLDTFSKDLIHDLNTPITSMLLNLKLLKQNPDIDKKILNRLQSSAQSISTLHANLNILLQNSTFKPERIDISGCISDLLNTYHTQYPDIRIQNQIGSFVVKANESALRQVLSNLISNAFKYNKKEGTVHIYSKAQQLIIEDTGVGIKNPHEVFTRNYKEHAQGVGIGLDITKRLCDAMQIDISVESTPNGSRFKLYFND